MIGIDFSAQNVVILTPVGALSADDFSQVTTTKDRHINEPDQVPNLIIHGGKLPHWESVRAFGRHLKFVRDHQQLVAKVAIVADNFAVRTLPLLMDLFVSAKVRTFAEAKLDEAREWAEASEGRPGRFERREGFPPDVIAIKARGIITSQDYRAVLVPLVEERLQSQGTPPVGTALRDCADILR